MFRKTIQMLCVLSLIAMLGIFVGSVDFNSSNAQESKFAKQYDEEVIALGGGMVTSMSLEELEENVDGSIEEMDLDDSRCFDFYKVDFDDGGISYIAINENSRKLTYKLSFYSLDKKEDIKDYLERKCGEPVDARGTLFYYNDDIGYKVSPYNEDVFQLWVGSVSLWDEAAEDTTFNTFEK